MVEHERKHHIKPDSERFSTKHHASKTHLHTETGLEKEEEQTIEDGLHAIYGEDKTDFSKIERPGSFLTHLLLTAVIVLTIIAGTAWGGYFVYQKYFSSQSQESFTVKISAPEEVKSGEKTKIKISYENPTTIPLAQLTVEARLPVGFVVSSSEPLVSDLTKPKWDIGFLNAGSDGEITLEGIWTATVPSTTPIQVFANFRPANFNSDFQAVQTTSITSLQSVLETTFTGDEEATSGKSQNYLLTIQNMGSEKIDNIIAQIKLPTGFYLESSDPALEAGSESEWKNISLDPGAKIDIKITGSFAADVTGFEYFDSEISIKNGNEPLSQSKAQTFTDVKGSAIALQLVAAGSNTDSSLFLSSNLRTSITYENTSDEDMSNVALLLDFSSAKAFPINWKTADLDGGKLTKDGVLWSIDVVGKIPAHEKKMLNLVFPIIETLSENFGDSFTITALANIADLSVRTTPIIISINSDASLVSEIRYYTEDGAPLGSGPIPPQVGQTTIYRVYWTVSNNLHNLENMIVTAILPPNVNWVGQSSSDLGTIEYKDISGEVVWMLPSLPEDVKSISAHFAISITPKTEDVGKFVKLISGANFKVTDEFTKALIEHTSESLDTELPSDVFATDKGAVIN